MSSDLERALDALHFIPPDLPREEWVKAGMAAHAAGLDFDAFNDWSAGAGNYDERAARDTWRSFKPGKGVGAGTLFKLAAENGWRNDGQKGQQRADIDYDAILNRLMHTPKQAAKPARKPAPGMSPGEVWNRCEAATHAHPYIVKKRTVGVPLDTLRVLPADDPLTIQGERMAGALVVPVIRPDGSLSSLQLIASPDVAARLKAKGKPGKLNLTGCPMDDGFFTVGELVPGGLAYIVEGIGAAWSCWQATGDAAVVCFGSSRMATVAAELRQRDASARLVLVPDVGKEEQAAKIAQEVGAAVVTMPDGWPQNSDVNDLAQREGNDALAALLEGAGAPLKPEPHPLAKFIDYDAKPKAVRWVIPGFIGHGVVIIAGAHGVGKTTALLPLAMVAAGLHGAGDELAPRHWRHVVYIVEDVEQAWRILAGIVEHGGLGIDAALVRERLHIVEALRLDPAYVAQVGKAYREQFTRLVGSVEILPLAVVDTKAAVLALENENDNSEASAAMASLKQGFEGLPVWLIGHVAKQNMNRSNLSELSLRGGSAFEADANQVLYLVKEDEARYLVRGKTRFEAKWSELQIKSECAQTMAEDEFGNMESVTLRWGIAVPPEQTRKEVKEQAQERQRKEDGAEMRDEVRNAIDEAWQSGFPLNKEGVKAKVKRKRNEVSDCLENLLCERWIYEVEVPAKVRAHSSRASFLVNFTTAEHEALLRDGEIPAAKLAIPASWTKPAIPPVPEPERVDGQKEAAPERE